MVLFYDDSPVFGGHEVMALHAVRGLLKARPESIVFFANPENGQLLQELEQISGELDRPDQLAIEKSPAPLSKPVAISRWFRQKDISDLADQFTTSAPDQVLVVQGDIASSVLGLLAAKRAGIPAISYIPVPHTLKEMGAKLGGFRDLLDAPLFKLPDGFITISESMATKLAARSRDAHVIDVVLNGIPDQDFQPIARDKAREKLELKHSEKIIALVGRLEFKQKQQDFLLSAFASSDLAKDASLLFVGDGPDKGRLQALVNRLDLNEQVTLLPWQQDMATVYSAADLLVIPSRFEGFPLVMLESVRCNTPVVAAAKDGMADFLPQEWLFEPGSKTDCIQKVTKVLTGQTEGQLYTLNSRIDSEMTIQAFQRNFSRSLAKFCPGRRQNLATAPSEYHPALKATETGLG